MYKRLVFKILSLHFLQLLIFKSLSARTHVNLLCLCLSYSPLLTEAVLSLRQLRDFSFGVYRALKQDWGIRWQESG